MHEGRKGYMLKGRGKAPCELKGQPLPAVVDVRLLPHGVEGPVVVGHGALILLYMMLASSPVGERRRGGENDASEDGVGGICLLNGYVGGAPAHIILKMKGGREGCREGGRQGRMQRGREGAREGGKDGERERGKEEQM